VVSSTTTKKAYNTAGGGSAGISRIGLSSAANHNLNAQIAKINNYLTIDVSGNAPITSIPALAGMHTLNQSGHRETMAASRIPKQKVLNIKIKENQFVPMTVTNRDRDSFKFSSTHFM